jgi:hypothetical protein
VLPTFLVIGAQKAATTTLWSALRQHPDVFLPDVKEPGFFATERSFAEDADRYRGLFAGSDGARARGEASTTYTMFPHYHGAAARIAQTVPDVRLVYVLRDPVERMRSAYTHAVALGSETRPMADALTEDLRYACHSLYATQLDQYLRWFAPEQVLLVSSDALRRDLHQAVLGVQAFLGVQPAPPAESVPDLNTGVGKRAPRPAWRRFGGFVLRHDLAGAVPERLRRMNDERHPLLTRSLRPDELELAPDLRERLRDLFRPDLLRLVPLADETTAGDLVRWAR